MQRSRRRRSLWSIYSDRRSLIICLCRPDAASHLPLGIVHDHLRRWCGQHALRAGWSAPECRTFGAGSRDTEGPLTLLWYKYVFDV
jgi:hypothetical protein